MLDENLKQQLQTYLERVTQPIEIVASLDDSDASREMLELLQDVASASSLITLTQRNDDSQRQPQENSRVAFVEGGERVPIPLRHRLN